MSRDTIPPPAGPGAERVSRRVLDAGRLRRPHLNDDPDHDAADAAQQAAALLQARRHDYGTAVMHLVLGQCDAAAVLRARIRVHAALDLLLDANALALRLIASRLRPGLPAVRPGKLPLLAVPTPAEVAAGGDGQEGRR